MKKGSLITLVVLAFLGVLSLPPDSKPICSDFKPIDGRMIRCTEKAPSAEAQAKADQEYVDRLIVRSVLISMFTPGR